MAHITKTPQYQLYQNAINALRQNGYETREEHCKRSGAQSGVFLNGNRCGYIFAVTNPYCGCLVNILLPWYARGKYSLSDFNIQHQVIKKYRERSVNIRVYWPDNHLVGGVMFPSDNQTDKWFSIIKTIFSI